jgi:hypothetical protein
LDIILSYTIPGALGLVVTYGRETYQPTGLMRWENGVFLMAQISPALNFGLV